MPGYPLAARERGSMLIVTMGVLTLITLLAVSFGLLMTLERQASIAYIDRVHSRVLAQAGIEAVIGQLKEEEALRTHSNPKSRLIFNRSKDGTPNYKARLEDLDPDKASLTRIIGSKYGDGDGANLAITKVIPANAMINVNDIHPTLPYILEGLGAVIQRLHQGKNPIPRGHGEKLVTLRDKVYGGKFDSKKQLKDVIGPENFSLVQDFLTAYSWRDTSAVMTTRDSINNPSAGIARGKVQFVRTEKQAALQTDLLKIGGRAPVNINEAPLEVLAAVILPIGGRRAYHPIPNMPAPVPIDPEYVAAGGEGNLSAFLEETDFQTLYFRKGGPTGQQRPYQWVFFPPYWKQTGGIDRAIALARAIIRERTGETHGSGRQKGPFQSVMDFEKWVDDLSNSDTYFLSTGETDIPTETRMPKWGPIRANPDYPRFHYESVKSMIKANFNPNALINSFNPSSAAWRPLDKGNLVYPTEEQINKVDISAGGQSSSVGEFIPCQSVDFCYGPMGVYEITSVGKVAGKADESLPPGKRRKIYGMTKLRSVVQLMGVVRHTSQRDFDRNDNLYNSGNRKRRFVRSYPENDIFWEPGDGSGRGSPGHGGGGCMQYGRVELDPSLSRTSEPRDKANLTLGVGGASRAQPLFEAKWDKRNRGASRGQFLLQDALKADLVGGGVKNAQSPLAQPFGTVVYRDHATVQGKTVNFVLLGGAQYPDGIHSSLSVEGKGMTGDARTLWFRAASLEPNPAAQGMSADEEDTAAPINVGMYKGSVEFWYKPDFDWAHWDDHNRSPIESNPLFCGLFQTTHVQLNDFVQAAGPTSNGNHPTRVVQMFVFRNTSGDIRIVRLYSELIGEDSPIEANDQLPLLTNPGDSTDPDLQYPDDPMTVSQYLWENSQGAKSHLYPWPPVNKDGNPQLEILQHHKPGKVIYARQDFVVPYDDLRFWRAHEWHHLAVSWDDSGGIGGEVPQDFIQVFIDGRPVNISQKVNYWMRGDVKPGVEGASGEFVRLNHHPIPGGDGDTPDPIAKDSMYVGCIHRPQVTKGGGVFKFDDVVTFGANGTIDDVRTYKDSIPEKVEVARPTDRFVTGTYEQRFEIPFPGNVNRIRLGSLSFTAYMPQEHDDADPNKVHGARLEVLVLRGQRPLNGFTGGGWVFQNSRTPGGFALTSDLKPTGKPEYLEKGETLSYRVRMVPGRNSLGNVATPVLDDVTLTYFLPKVAVLYQEEVLDY